MVNDCLTGAVTPHVETPQAGLKIFDPAKVLALGYAPASSRKLFTSFFLLDQKVERIVRTAKEPVLAQMRLAWWRDQIGTLGAVNHADPLLQLLASAWSGHEAGLLELIDGWEELLGQPVRPSSDLYAIIQKQAAPYRTIASRVAPSVPMEAVQGASRSIAAAGLITHLENEEERQVVRAVAAGIPPTSFRFARPLRPLAVLYALSKRMLGRGGTRLLERPADMVAAFKAGVRGR